LGVVGLPVVLVWREQPVYPDLKVAWGQQGDLDFLDEPEYLALQEQLEMLEELAILDQLVVLVQLGPLDLLGLSEQLVLLGSRVPLEQQVLPVVAVQLDPLVVWALLGSRGLKVLLEFKVELVRVALLDLQDRRDSLEQQVQLVELVYQVLEEHLVSAVSVL
jgi:hypothetical protein